MSDIGLLNEKPLHASLKEWYAQPGDRLEVAVNGFVIDIVRDDLLLEVQTGSFSSIKSKLTSLVTSRRVRLIYPIAQEKWIVKLAKNGSGKANRRKSPKRGRVEDLFWEMVRLPLLMANHNFSLEVLMTKEEEVRRYVGRRKRRSRGWGIEERRLLEVVDQRLFREPADWRAFVPEELELFTTKDLAKAAGISRQLAQKMAYCLRKAKVVKLTGKKERCNLYRVVGT